MTNEIYAPIALTIAGSDSGGGAGIQADLKAFSALRVFGASVITAITAQNTQAVTAVHDVPVDVIAAQLNAVLSDLNVRAIKIGMLSSPAIIECVADQLADFNGPVVLDPVMVSKSGARLLQPDALDALRAKLIPLATIVTPNLPEAADITDTNETQDVAELAAQAQAILAMGAKAVLMKGGHATGEICTDLLYTSGEPALELAAPRVRTKNTHGTGCTYSASIAAGLARELALQDAVAAAHDYLSKAIVAADRLEIGSGHGPVHHFHELWS
ncbi:MAG: bifunctional hydroxymethylpyrimidine kinase/phosphomethylpyrimidine kinase [Pseudomonadota bacterium]